MTLCRLYPSTTNRFCRPPRTVDLNPAADPGVLGAAYRQCFTSQPTLQPTASPSCGSNIQSEQFCVDNNACCGPNSAVFTSFCRATCCDITCPPTSMPTS